MTQLVVLSQIHRLLSTSPARVAGSSAVTHGVQIEWPLSIVISQQAMTQYQLIFRHLFELKYVERQLVGVWQVLQATRGLFRSTTPAPHLHPCYHSLSGSLELCKSGTANQRHLLSGPS